MAPLEKPPLDEGDGWDPPGLLDEAAGRLGFRDRLRANPTTLLVYRVLVGMIGVAVIGAGIVMLPFPGPGWLTIFLGLGILASEFGWAERLLDLVRAKVRLWWAWLGHQPLFVRGLVTVVGLVFVGAILVAALRLTGVPSWVSEGAPLIR